MSSLLSTEQIGHSFSDHWLFKNISLGIAKGQAIALVGPNGAGKSTLIKILAEKIIPQEGRVVKAKDLKTGYLEQDPDFPEYATIGDFIYSAENRQQALIRDYEALLEQENPDQVLLGHLTDEISE